MDGLPDELFQWILSYVPSAQLLPLRLVCRRWSHAILEKAVWQHRDLWGTNDDVGDDYEGFFPRKHSNVNTGLIRTIVRLVPAVGRVYLYLKAGSTAGVAALEALARGTCQVRELSLSLSLQSPLGKPPSKRLMTALRRVLQVQREIKELALSLLCLWFPSDRGPVDLSTTKVLINQIFSRVDSCSMTKFRISFQCGSCPDARCLRDALGYQFRELCSLRELNFDGYRCGLSDNTMRSLLITAKDTLEVVRSSSDIRIAPVLDVLPQCRLLKELDIPAVADWSFLRQCRGLDLLIVTAERCSPGGEKALDSVRRLLEETRVAVRVVASNFSLEQLLAESAFLQRVRHLSIRSTYWQQNLHWLQLLQKMPVLQDLQVDAAITDSLPHFDENEPPPPTCLCGWTPDMVPSLARLTVQIHFSRLEKTNFRAAAKRLQLSRPHLRFFLRVTR